MYNVDLIEALGIFLSAYFKWNRNILMKVLMYLRSWSASLGQNQKHYWKRGTGIEELASVLTYISHINARLAGGSLLKLR